MKHRAVGATLWSALDAFSRHGIQFAFTVVLARLVSPEEFGTVALLAFFIGIASVFIDSGFSSALIQRRDSSHDDESTVFWFNLATGCVTGLMLACAGPWLASFFAVAVLEPLAILLAFNVVLSSVGAIQNTLLAKDLNFRTPAKIGAYAATVGGLTSVLLAWRGFGIWALAAQSVATTLVSTLLLWVTSRWRPKLVFSLASARKLFGFGSYLLASGLLDVTYNRMNAFLIGKYFGVRDLGLYNRADGVKQLPVGVLTGMLARVAFPIFSASASEKEVLRRGLQHSIRTLMLINVPLMMGLIAVAESFILALYGPRWAPAVPILQVLCLGGLLWPLHVLNLSVLTAQGHSQLFFQLELIKKGIGVVLLIVGLQYGVLGVAASQVVLSLVAFMLNAHYSAVHLRYGTWQQAKDVLPLLTAAALMGAGVYAFGLAMELHPALEVFMQLVAGVLIYGTVCYLFRVQAFIEARRLMCEYLARSENSTR